jgi:hypothetical protein
MNAEIPSAFDHPHLLTSQPLARELTLRAFLGIFPG